MRTTVPARIWGSISRFIFGYEHDVTMEYGTGLVGKAPAGLATQFLLLPKTINGETRWLEWATWRWETNYRWSGMAVSKVPFPNPVEWVDE